ncbi:putative metal-dependent hydrolase [Novosphingobium chloroacetimidivorans]|uniref:Putative metal-dependent hydrolase n=1 Tax=Novosphingobium chloroacetimidivorans TaxID=1428314 RepID=A0A7W7KD66_9SPHN|nr:M48 family metallopeptidase [Novosphingobium chloroacetimidivorans]MBB4860684.1 putative metal-dependent hydrolase [Novosphingobium chloroacetimidivorans]
MLDWLRRDPRAVPTLAVAGRELPIVVRRLDRARRMTMRLAPDGSEVRISIPTWARSAEALAFARSRQSWLERQLTALPSPSPLGPGTTIRFRGEPLTIRHEASARRRPVLDDGALTVGGPLTAIEARVGRWLQAEARTLLTRDLEHYCTRAGRPVSALALSNARRRWGSCAANGAIRINWRLIMAPDTVRRSVVAHEVAHLLHFDHSPAFHACLATLFEGDVGAANDWLKREGRGLYRTFG